MVKVTINIMSLKNSLAVDKPKATAIKKMVVELCTQYQLLHQHSKQEKFDEFTVFITVIFQS